MTKSKFTFTSENGGTTIHCRMWEPDTPPLGVLQIIHGITEHIDRYDDIARYFTDMGYAVVGNDHLGHGLSVDPKNPTPMYFGPEGSWDYVVGDVENCIHIVKEKYPELPYCLLGFSLGSFAVRCLLGKRPKIVDYAILVGTGQFSALELCIAGMVVKSEERQHGGIAHTPLLHSITMQSYNRHFEPCRTKSDWLCANPEAVDEYIADPLCGEGFTVGSFRELLNGMKTCCNAEHYRRMESTLPILLVSGKEDPVGGFGKGVTKVYNMFSKHGFADVEMHLFEGMRHDVFHEKDGETVLVYINDWMHRHHVAG